MNNLEVTTRIPTPLSQIATEMRRSVLQSIPTVTRLHVLDSSEGVLLTRLLCLRRHSVGICYRLAVFAKKTTSDPTLLWTAAKERQFKSPHPLAKRKTSPSNLALRLKGTVSPNHFPFDQHCRGGGSV